MADELKPVTDPDLLKKLEGGDAPKPVADPKLLAQLEGGDAETPANGDAPTPKASVLDRVGTGMLDPVYGMGQLQAHSFGNIGQDTEIGRAMRGHKIRSAEEIDKAILDREKEIQKERGGETGVDWARVGGNMLSPANLVLPAPAKAGMLAKSAVMGAEGGMLAPTAKEHLTGPEYVKEKAKDALFGAAFGTGTGAAVGALAPKLGSKAQSLLDKGNELTPGQMAGGYVRRAEEIAKSFPILGHFIRGAEQRSLDSFNTTAINQALAPIDEKLPSAVKAGRGAIDYANARLSAAYDKLLPTMQFSIHNDPQFVTDMANLRTLAAEMPKDQAAQFDNIIQNRVAQRLAGSGTMDGQTLKQVESELGHLASQYQTSADAAHRQLGQALSQAKMNIVASLQRQNPEKAVELGRINSAYAMFTRMQGAAARRAGSEGVFTPMDLLQSIKSMDRTVRKGDFARGDALLQEFAEIAQHVLPSKVPDSGTAERLLLYDIGGGAGAYAANPHIPMALGAASLPYTAPATKALNAYARSGGLIQGQAGEAARLAAPYAGAGAGEAASELGVSQ